MFKVGANRKIDLEAMFSGVAAGTGKAFDIVEKDFWVCWTLLYLFQESPWRTNLAFKGGTSLSKGFNIISRFSEDIDVILDWRLLGYTDAEVWQPRSRSKDLVHVGLMNERGAAFLGGEFLDRLNADFKALLPRGGFELFVDAKNPQTINFQYPKATSAAGESAILDVIKLEMGANAAWTPSRPITVTPFVSEMLGDSMTHPSVTVLTADPKRTFWEKVTILHKVAWESHKPLPPRYARHYYDIYMMDKTTVKEDAFTDIDLLTRVVDFKNRFYQCPAHIYASAKPGSMKLLPHPDHIAELQRDYRLTTTMMYGDIPSFDAIIECLGRMEQEINNLQTP